ncbi:MAG: 2-dehydropantoate 2-reductase [Candidatus Omnitrophota bacterium]
MRITVIGSGAIGALVAGYLKLKEEDVLLIGRGESIAAIRKKGINISGVRGNFKVNIPIKEKVDSFAEVVVLATKTQDIQVVLESNSGLLKDSIIITTQNGVQAEKIVSKYFPVENIISSIVMFGSTYLKPAEVVHNFEGSWILGKLSNITIDEKIVELSKTLDKAFPVVISEDITGMKYLKIFVNANNCIPAILGVSMQEAFSDIMVSRVSINILREGFDIISKSGIKLVSLPGFPLENITKLISLPLEEAARIYSGMMTKLSKEALYGSILQSIKRNRLSEIDFINGEFVSLAKEHNLSAGLNSRLVSMVHQVELNKRFFNKDEFLENVKEYLN